MLGLEVHEKKKTLDKSPRGPLATGGRPQLVLSGYHLLGLELVTNRQWAKGARLLG